MKKIIFCAIVAALCGCGLNPLNADNGRVNIVAFGDSLTDGYGTTRETAFPAVLQELAGRPVINLGGGGDTARMGADRKEEIAKYDPFMVLIQFSGNDFLRKRPLSETRAATEEIVDYVQSLGAIAVIVDTGGFNEIKPYTKMLQEIAARKKAVFVPGMLDGIADKPDLMSDQIHPNAEGYRLVGEKIFQALKDFL